MKKFYLLAFILTGALLAGCNNDDILKEAETTTNGKRVMKITTNMPAESDTRVNANEDDSGVNLTWKVGDEIHFFFADPNTNSLITTYTHTLESGDVSSLGRRAYFNFNIPDDVTENFDLYGVHGGDGLSTDNKHVKLHDINNSSSNEVELLAQNNIPMIRFESKNIDINKSEIEINVTFKHIGAFFKVLLQNQGTKTMMGIQNMNFVGVGNSNLPVHFAYAGMASYNPITEEFHNTLSNFMLPLKTEYLRNIQPGAHRVFWLWVPLKENETWPAFNIRVEQRTSATATAAGRVAANGKSYRLYARYDENHILRLATSADITPDPNYIVDDRDGNVYKTVTIGDRTWFAENLRYMPSVIGVHQGIAVPGMSYGNTNPDAVKSLDAYKKYGVYYGQFEGLSDQGTKAINVCPDGWHVPSDENYGGEYIYGDISNLTNYIDNIATNPAVPIGKALKSAGTKYWNYYHEDEMGEDHYGFDLRGAGRLIVDETTQTLTHEEEKTEALMPTAWYFYHPNRRYYDGGISFSYSADFIRGVGSYTYIFHPIRCVKDN